MKLFSPAKVNLFLGIVRKRKDGYHDIETLFERIRLGDDIVLTPRKSGIALTCRGDSASRPYTVPADATNLAWRAAKLLQDRCHKGAGVHISIRKRIPVAAGLGGASSNAATVLLGLNRFWGLRLPRTRLMELGARLGSDVPFFLLETPFALGRGRGGLLRKVRGSKKFWHVLVKPPFGISTKQAYQGLKPPFLTLPKADVKMLLHSIQKGDLESLSGLLSNSLEVTLNKRVTTISKIKKMLLKEGALGALLSGSGSTVFGLFSTQAKARRAAARLRKAHRAWKVFVASTY